jgi:hypothetical protein
MKELKGGQAPGLNRVTWDLSPAEHLQLHDENEEPFNKFHIRPGQYKIKVTMGDHSIEKAMVVLPRD